MGKEGLIRRDGVDILKLICAFLVICIHKPFYGKIGEYIVAISRCAVPIFFMITGFFYKNTIHKGNENKQIVKILKLCIFSNLLYLAYNIAGCILSNDSVNVLLRSMFSVENIKDMLFFNVTPIASHLWYLNALLYVLIIMKFINKYNKYRVLEVLTPFLLLIDLIFGKYSLAILKTEIPFIYVRNFLFVGLPYFCIGNYIHKAIDANKKINNKCIVLSIFIFLATTILERYVLVQFNLNAVRDHYISSTLLAVSLFLCFLNYGEGTKNFIIKGLSKIGKSYSTNIYIFHVIVMGILNKILKADTIYSYISPIYIFVCTILVCAIYEVVNKWIMAVAKK